MSECGPSSCESFYRYPMFISASQRLIVGSKFHLCPQPTYWLSYATMEAIFTLRTYCIYERSTWIASVVGVLALGDFAMKIVRQSYYDNFLQLRVESLSSSVQCGQHLSSYHLALAVATSWYLLHSNSATLSVSLESNLYWQHGQSLCVLADGGHHR